MQAESYKGFQFGFVLTEAELRRIINIAEEQFVKLSERCTHSFTIKFRNGAVATSSTLDEVISQENIGSSQITALAIEIESASNDVQEDMLNSISVEFVNLELANLPGTRAISFRIQGESRDWVFITSSLLEERISKIKRYPLRRYLGLKSDSILNPYIAVGLIGIIIGMFWFLNRSDSFVDTPRTSVSAVSTPEPVPFSERWKNELKSNTIKDPIEALVMRERLYEQLEKERIAKDREESVRWRQIVVQRPQRTSPFAVLAIAGLTPPLMLIFISAFLAAYFPPYAFCWGDYVEVFRRKESVRRFVVVVVLVGILVSFVGGILANFTQIGR